MENGFLVSIDVVYHPSHVIPCLGAWAFHQCVFTHKSRKRSKHRAHARARGFARPIVGNIYKKNLLGNNMCRAVIRSQKASITQPLRNLQAVLSQELYRVEISKIQPARVMRNGPIIEVSNVFYLLCTKF